MKPAVILSLGLALLSETASAKSGFLESCSLNWVLQKDSWLVAKCRESDTVSHIQMLDLNRCVMNKNGRLRARENGNAMKSCRNCVKTSPNFLTCQCPSGGKMHKTYINLNDVIGNVNGWMMCFDQKASPVRLKKKPAKQSS